MPKETVEARAVKIAARVMTEAGLCKHETPTACKRYWVDEETCDMCMRAWLMAKARKELAKEQQQCRKNT